jgi:fluoride ion exporter CrcB/FEX
MDASFAVMSLAIGAGSALGGILRYWCSLLIARTLGETFPLGMLFVNVAGFFLISSPKLPVPTAACSLDSS